MFITLGAFLRDGFSVSGNRNLIMLNTRNGKDFMLFRPRVPGDTIFVLQTVDWINYCNNAYSTANPVDFNTLHRHFGHPSKEALRHAKEHITNFPQIEFPKDSPFCPGCARGKMPNKSFLPLLHHAIHPFQLIHLDIKSFPTLSYYHQRYMITFYDDYISYTWVSMLTSKDKAIQATRHFLSLIENQYHISVKL